MMRRATLSCCLLFFAGRAACFVAPGATRHRQFVMQSRICPRYAAPSIVLLQDDDELPPDSNGSKQSSDDNVSPLQKLVRRVFDVIFIVQSFVIQGLGYALGVGLVLNLCGIGYRFNAQEGLVIKPLSEMRDEISDRRFTRDAARLMDEPPPFRDEVRPRR